MHLIYEPPVRLGEEKKPYSSIFATGWIDSSCYVIHLLLRGTESHNEFPFLQLLPPEYIKKTYKNSSLEKEQRNHTTKHRS